jgi:hypothetical protein
MKLSKRFFLRYFLAAGGALLIMIFLGWHFLSVVLAPDIYITQPAQKEITTSQEELLIRGQAKRAYFLRINQELIPVDNQGNFEDVINLQEGLNMINIKAETRFGKISQYQLKILHN